MGKKTKKVQSKKNLMVGLLVLAMIAFIGGQIPWNNFKKSSPPTRTNAVTENVVSSIATKALKVR